MFAQERQKIISEILERKSSVKVNEIASMLNVSESTVRRDLQEMEERNLLERTHGGAVGVDIKTNYEPSFKDKQDERIEQKIRIAEAASKIIEEDDTIILDSGTTTLEIAKMIEGKHATVITNSIDIASQLSQNEQVEVIVTGGTLRVSTRAMVGSIAETTLKNFRVDKAFIGANGISAEEGITTPNFIEAQTKKMMMSYAKKVIVVADSSKFENVCFSVVCPVKSVDMIITSEDVSEDILKEYEQIGVDVITA